MCITLILPDQASNRRLLMDIYENDIFVHFLVCVPAISAQAWRYHRFVTGTIRLMGYTAEGLTLLSTL